MDERAGLKLAQTLALPTIGTIGILLLPPPPTNSPTSPKLKSLKTSIDTTKPHLKIRHHKNYICPLPRLETLREFTMKAIETTATLTENGQLTLDQPLNLAQNSRVRVIVLIAESEEDLDDTAIAEIREGLYQGWQDILAGRTQPVAQLWEGVDID